MILFIFNVHAATDLPNKAEVDSVKLVLRNCDTDTCKFSTLSNIFWKYYFTKFKYAKYYGEWAFSEIKSSNNLKMLADGYHIKAHILKDEGKLDSAYYFFKKSLPLSEKTGYKFKVAWSYYRLGEIDIIFGNTKKAIEELEAAIKYFTEIGDENQAGAAIFLIADYLHSLGYFDSAIVYYEKSLIIQRKYSHKKYEIYSLLNISNCYKYLNNIKKSIEYLRNALSIAEALNDGELLTYVYWEIGNSFSENKKNYTIARNYYKKALETAKKSNLKKLIAELYSQISTTYLEEGKSDTALEYNLKSLKISEDINSKHSLYWTFMNLGFTYKKLGNYKLALESFNKCLQNKCSCCPDINNHKLFIEIGNIHKELKDSKKAFYWYEKALKLAEISNAKKETAKSKFVIGNYYHNINQFRLAESYYLHALQDAKEVKSILLIKSIADSLSRYYLSGNNYKSALDYIQIARAMDDSLAKTEKQASMVNLEMNFEFEQLKKDNEAKAIKSGEEIKRQRMYLYFSILISILLAVLGTVVFISYRRKKKDNILLALQKEEITAQKNEIENISEQLHKADQMKLTFFTNISHELRTPLTLVLSPLMKLIKGTGGNELSNLYSLMYRNTRKLQVLLNQLLDISRLDKDKLKLNIKLHNFNKLVCTTASMFQTIAEEKKIHFRLIEKHENLIFCFDAERIDLIINNLLSNAFKFTPEGGEICLQVSLLKNQGPCFDPFNSKQVINNLQTNEFVEIKITDNGIGIPPESINKIFDRFYQCDSAIVRSFEGSGIGLTLTKELVELHNGKISVQSEPGRWTEFTVNIPMIKDNLDQAIEDYSPLNMIEDVENVSNFITSGKKQTSSKLPGTILLVEDNIDLRYYLSNFLSAEFCQVLTSCNGTEGIKAAIKNVPDIIISDVMMPGMDGYQLTVKLRERIETSHIPIILLTAKAAQESKMEGLEKGAIDYIIKPFDEDELLQKIKNILENRLRLQEKFRKQISVNPSEVNVKSLDEQFLIKLTLIIEQEIANPDLNVNFLCNEIGLSRTQLFKKLKALTNLSISQFTRSIRLKRAAQLLEKKSASVSEIAYMTGFENLSYFTKIFKEEFGKIPSEY